MPTDLLLSASPPALSREILEAVARAHADVVSCMELPLHVQQVKHGTAAEIAWLSSETSGRVKLNTRLVDFCPIGAPPRRRKWDQYGSYYRRQLKKWSARYGL